MRLPEHLKKKRDELAYKFVNDVSGVSQSILSPKGCYLAGYADACAELLPIIEKLEKALDFVEIDCGDNSCKYAKEKTGMRTNGGCRCVGGKHRHTIERHLFFQKIALAELKKWMES